MLISHKTTQLIYTPVSNKDVYHVDILYNVLTTKKNAFQFHLLIIFFNIHEMPY